MTKCLACFWMIISITQKLKILSLDDGNWKYNFGVSMTKTCCSSIVTGGFFFLFLLHAFFFFFPCLFLRLLLISFLFPSPISFLNFVLFLSLFLLSRFVGVFFFVGLSGTFYRFFCLFLYFFFVFFFFCLFFCFCFWWVCLVLSMVF